MLMWSDGVEKHKRNLCLSGAVHCKQNSIVHSIIHSTIPVHIPVQWLRHPIPKYPYLVVWRAKNNDLTDFICTSFHSTIPVQTPHS